MVTDLEMIKCSRCGEPFPKLRLDKYGYDFCIKCSDVQKKVGRIRVVGEGDHTVTVLDILDQNTARKLQKLENASRGIKNIPLEVLNYDEEEITDNSKILDAIVERALNDEFEEEIPEEDTEDLRDIEEIVQDEEEND